MKKLLALVLALVMTLSLCTVTNAAYPDAADVDYKEAVDVMSAVGVFKGDEKGNFNPDATLTRETAAKLIAYLDLGEKTAEALPAVKVFSDVEANRWSAKYVAYCADAGYIAGVGDGTFNPTGELTGYAFGKLLLCVLGYDANIEQFTGPNWSIAVAKLMESNGIAKGVDKAASSVLTREEAAQFCLNALKATMVNYDNKGTNISINGATIATGASKAEEVVSAETYALAIDDTVVSGKSAVQLGEKLYKGDLELNATPDAFGRPGDTWTYAKDEDFEANAADEAILTFTAAVSASDVAKKINKVTKNYSYPTADTDKWVDGVKTADQTFSDSDIQTLTGNGVLVEVYANSKKEITDVVVVNEYLGKITSVTKANADTDTKRSVTVAGKTFETEDFAKGDYVVYTLANGAIKTMAAAKTVEGKITATTGSPVTSAKIDGTAYKFNKAYTFVADAGDEVCIYLDSYGYLRLDGTVKASVAAVTDYAVVIGMSDAAGWTGNQVKVLKSDGTKEILDIEDDADKTDDINYSALNKGDFVTLKDGDGDGKWNFYAPKTGTDKDVPATYCGYADYAATGAYNKTKGTLNAWNIADEAVVFVATGDADEPYKVVTGAELKKADTVTVNALYANKASTGYKSIELAYVNSSMAASTDFLYGYVVAATETVLNAKDVKVDSVTFWNGSEKVTALATASGTGLDKGDFFRYKLNEDGCLTNISEDAANVGAAKVVEAFDGSAIKFEGDATVYDVDKDTVVIYVDVENFAGVADGEIVLAQKNAADTAYLKNVIALADGDNDIVVIFVDVANDIEDVE